MKYEDVEVGKRYKINYAYDGLRGIFKTGEIITVVKKDNEFCLVESNGKSHYVYPFRLGELEER